MSSWISEFGSNQTNDPNQYSSVVLYCCLRQSLDCIGGSRWTVRCLLPHDCDEKPCVCCSDAAAHLRPAAAVMNLAILAALRTQVRMKPARFGVGERYPIAKNRPSVASAVSTVRVAAGPHEQTKLVAAVFAAVFAEIAKSCRSVKQASWPQRLDQVSSLRRRWLVRR